MKGGDQLKKHKIKHITLALLITFATAAAAVKASQALFTDSELSANTVSMGTLNLQVGETDPVDLTLDLAMLPQEQKVFQVQLKNTGAVDGNFWIEPSYSNSLEGENPEPETDTEGEGDLPNCIRLAMLVEDPNTQQEALINYYNLDVLEPSYDTEPNTIIDQMVNNGEATLTIEVDAYNCYNYAMGDSVDLDLLFHLDQVM